MAKKEDQAAGQPWEPEVAGPSKLNETASPGPEAGTTETPPPPGPEAGPSPEAPSSEGEVVDAEFVEDPRDITEMQETLKCPLTDLQYKEYGIKMGQANRAIQKAEEEFAAVKSQFKSRIESATASRNEMGSIINSGCEYKPVLCHLIKDYQENTVTVIRLDTLEIVRTRTMGIEERQRGLDFEKSKSEKPAEASE